MFGAIPAFYPVFHPVSESPGTSELPGPEILCLDLLVFVVVDEENRFRGVVERNRILSLMIMALAKGAKAHPSA